MSRKQINLSDVRNVQQFINEYWMGLGDTDKHKVNNSLLKYTKDDSANPSLWLLKYIRNPDNFYFTCKWIFNVELLPFQLLVLKELWNRPFPMLLASRGASKCITVDTLLFTNTGIKKVSDFIPEDGMLDKTKIDNITDLQLHGENGFKSPEYFWKNENSETFKITTSYGYNIEGTPEHPIRVIRNGEMQWVELKDIVIDDIIPIKRSYDWSSFKGNDLPEDLAYFFGLIVGDGGYTVRGRISFTSIDQELKDKVNEIAFKYFNKTFSQSKRYIESILYGVKIWDELFNKYGFNSPVCGEKEFPTSVLGASRESLAAFVRGLFDTDGWVTTDKPEVGFSAKSENMAKQMHFILTLFGMNPRIKRDLNKKYNKYYSKVLVTGAKNLRVFRDNIGFGLTRKKILLDKHCLKNSNPNRDMIPKEYCLSYITDLINTELSSRKRNVDNLNDLLNGKPSKSEIDTSFNRKGCSLYHYQAYDCSFAKLEQLLSLTKHVAHKCKSWQILKDILDNHYFYDRVTSIEKSQNDTYDLYIPDDHSFVTNGIVSHNSYLLGLYVIMRLLLTPKCKVVVTGAGLRQSRLIYDYSEMIWRNAPVLRSIVGNLKGQGPAREIDRFTFNIGNCRASFLPIGNGEKIRGERSGYTITDEFNSVDCEIYENVIAPFGAVTLSPIDNVKQYAQEQAMKELGILLDDEKLFKRQKNQQVLSGTPGYHFQHFYRYYMKQKAIIESGGDKKKLTEILGAPPDDDFDWRDYSIMRLPYQLIPPGFMDTTQIARSRATVDTGRFTMEYLATFIKDSNGFFRRSLIEGCVVSPNNIITLPSCGQVMFSASLIGSRDKKYIISIDPASESDNFSITILEQHSDHARIVYCWTTNRQKFKSKLKNGTNPMKRDFYGYCVRKIRDLMRLFNIEDIGLDTQGGGVAIEEGLASPLYIEDGEVPIYPVIDPDKPLPTDGLAGLHILHRINFADAKWTSEANHGMRKDFEDKLLLFPYYDQVSLALASEEDIMLNKDEDTLEDCVMEIEELKDELTTIVMSQTAMNNRERWDTPETKEPGTNKKGRLRKDRYSSLLIGNMIARSKRLQLPDVTYDIVGRVASDQYGAKTKSNKMYGGDARWAEVTEDCFISVTRR